MSRLHDDGPAILSRRSWLRSSACSLLSFSLGSAGRASARSTAGSGGKAKACIMLFLTGGAAQHDTFDPKPAAPVEIRGDFRPIATSVPGVYIGEHLPLLARSAHRFAIIRSVWHNTTLHAAGAHYNLTGLAPAPGRVGEPLADRRDPPCIGSVIRQVRGDRRGLPAAVQLPRPIGDNNNHMWAGQHAGFLGARYDPLFLFDESWVPGEPLPGFVPPTGVSADRQAARGQLLETLQAQRAAESVAERSYARFQQQALEVLRASPAWKAFRLDGEKSTTVERYGNNRFGRSCLLARRLIEAGVGLVTVPWMHRNFEQNFDTHSKHFPKMKDVLLPPLDRALSALLEDLAERGLLDETLVACSTEFGRSPRVNPGGGRDHWSSVYATVLAGGGIRGGRVYGRSDKDGGTPADNAVHVSDLMATMYHALGYDSRTEVRDQTGRPHFIVEGRPVLELFAG